jgi:hypothetical protein
MAIAGHVSRRMLERYSNVRMEAKRNAIGLGFVGLIMAVALVVRVFGMLTDGTVQESMGLRARGSDHSSRFHCWCFHRARQA